MIVGRLNKSGDEIVNTIALLWSDWAKFPKRFESAKREGPLSSEVERRT
jgi:hypothetical protein